MKELMDVEIHIWKDEEEEIKDKKCSTYSKEVKYKTTLRQHCFLFMYSQKRFSHALLLISIKYFRNRITMFCLKLWYYVENYIILDAALQLSHREQHISKQNYEITVVQEIHISRLEILYKDGTLNLFLYFSKVYIWNLGLRFV